MSAVSEPQRRLRYRPVLALGEGGMAEVSLAIGRGPSGFNKLVVLKTLRDRLVPDEEMRSMFLAEARLSARLNHANVVQVYEVVDTTRPCMVMEYLEGQPMSALLQAGGQGFDTAMQLRVLSAALEGLHYSHELKDYDGTPLNIVHRDVSPQNIFITYDGQVKVLDFGIAKATNAPNAPNATSTGVVKGKISYMAREQLLGEKIDRRADIYSAGCMLWQAAAGAKLWSGFEDGQVMCRLIDGEIPSPSSVRGVDPRLEAIVMKALAPDPEDRYATALDLRDAIEHFLSDSNAKSTMRDVAAYASRLFAENRDERSLAIHAALTAPRSLAPDDGSASPPLAPGGHSAVRERRRRQPAIALIVAGLLGAGAIAEYVASREKTKDVAAPVAMQPAAPKTFQLSLSVMPRQAAVTIDGKPVLDNPATLPVVPDQLGHTVRAALSGYQPVERIVRFESDLRLDITLKEAPQAIPEPSSTPTEGAVSGSGGRVAPSQRVGRTKSPPQVGAADDRCNPPWYYDKGIKVYKQGCL